jgi:hypothetical protein
MQQRGSQLLPHADDALSELGLSTPGMERAASPWRSHVGAQGLFFLKNFLGMVI